MIISYEDFLAKSLITVSISQKISGCLYLGLVLVEQSVAKGGFIEGCFCSFNGGHNYFKFQLYGNAEDYNAQAFKPFFGCE